MIPSCRPSPASDAAATATGIGARRKEARGVHVSGEESFVSYGTESKIFEISHVRNIGQQLQDLPDNRRPNSISLRK